MKQVSQLGFSVTPESNNPYGNILPKGSLVSENMSIIPFPWSTEEGRALLRTDPLSFLKKSQNALVRAATVRMAGTPYVHYLMAMNQATLGQGGCQKNVILGHSTLAWDCVKELVNHEFRISTEGTYMVPKEIFFGLTKKDFLIEHMILIMHFACEKDSQQKRSAKHLSMQQIEMALSYVALPLDHSKAYRAYQNRFNPAWNHELDTGCIARIVYSLIFATIDACRVLYVMIDCLKRPENYVGALTVEEAACFLKANLTGETVADFEAQLKTLQESAKAFFKDTLCRHLRPLEFEKAFQYGETSPFQFGGRWQVKSEKVSLKDRDLSALTAFAKSCHATVEDNTTLHHWIEKLKTVLVSHTAYSDLFPTDISVIEESHFRKSPLKSSCQMVSLSAASFWLVNKVLPTSMMGVGFELFAIYGLFCSLLGLARSRAQGHAPLKMQLLVFTTNIALVLLACLSVRQADWLPTPNY